MNVVVCYEFRKDGSPKASTYGRHMMHNTKPITDPHFLLFADSLTRGQRQFVELTSLDTVGFEYKQIQPAHVIKLVRQP